MASALWKFDFRGNLSIFTVGFILTSLYILRESSLLRALSRGVPFRFPKVLKYRSQVQDNFHRAKREDTKKRAEKKDGKKKKKETEQLAGKETDARDGRAEEQREKD